ncbi:hypothetical protein CRUP_007700 [Coryphaenoides rupestris]|nr:hypothetical protein CRUP_007700 [Coryphaenoides rupestris]
MAPQLLAPRLPQPSPPGQPPTVGPQSFQLPPGMVLVRSESGQLLMIHQQALAQMQAQAAQAAAAPRQAPPAAMPPAQAPWIPAGSRPVAPGNMVRQGSPGTTTIPPTATLHRPPVVQETMENVKKCRNFLSTLIKLASTGKQSAKTADNVKELVKELLEGKLEAEDFTSKLYSELNSSPQPYLVPFLKLTPNAALFTQQSQSPQPPASTPPPAKALPSPATVVFSSPGPGLTGAVTRPQIQPAVSRPGPTNQMLLQAQPQPVAMRPQVAVATSPVMMPRNQTPGQIIPGPQQQLWQLNSGVNLTEESARILATNSELVGAVTHSCKEEAFLATAVLQRRIVEIGKRFGVTELGGDLVAYVSHATQQRLQNLLEKVSQVAQHKNFIFKEDDSLEASGDVRAQLRFFEQLDQLERQRKEGQERQILLKAAKSRARQEDPEQLRLKQKAKEMQQQELAMMRQKEANLTALAAIGPRKKRKLMDAAAPSDGASEGSVGSGSALSGGAGGGGAASSVGSRPTRQRITRINLRDLLFCLETERFTGRSHFLYKGFLK